MKFNINLNNGYQIIDNFLSPQDHEKIHFLMYESKNFPWYFIDFVSGNSDQYIFDLEKKDKDKFMFTHVFFQDYFNVSTEINNILPLIRNIHPDSLVRIKANLYTKTNERIIHGFHIDYNYDCYSSVYYVNTNNGATILENGVEITSIANRLLILGPNIKHASTSCTDQKCRIVINTNFFKKKVQEL